MRFLTTIFTALALLFVLDRQAAAQPSLVAAEEVTLRASSATAGDYLGWSVSLSADGSRALVGAPMDDTLGGIDAGSARVFVRSGTGWTEEATLFAAGGAANDISGWSVSLDADGSRAIIGVPSDDTPSGLDVGTARVFVRSGAGWTEEAALRASGAAAGDWFGVSVAISADGMRAVVGAYYDDTAAGVDAGSARVFVRSGASWRCINSPSRMQPRICGTPLAWRRPPAWQTRWAPPSAMPLRKPRRRARAAPLCPACQIISRH